MFSENSRENFLWALAQNNDSGSLFTCAIYLTIDDESPITNANFSDHDPRLQTLDCETMLAITGDFLPYQYGHEKYTKDHPANLVQAEDAERTERRIADRLEQPHSRPGIARGNYG